MSIDFNRIEQIRALHNRIAVDGPKATFGPFMPGTPGHALVTAIDNNKKDIEFLLDVVTQLESLNELEYDLRRGFQHSAERWENNLRDVADTLMDMADNPHRTVSQGVGVPAEHYLRVADVRAVVAPFASEDENE